MGAFDNLINGATNIVRNLGNNVSNITGNSGFGGLFGNAINNITNTVADNAEQRWREAEEQRAREAAQKAAQEAARKQAFQTAVNTAVTGIANMGLDTASNILNNNAPSREDLASQFASIGQDFNDNLKKKTISDNWQQLSKEQQEQVGKTVNSAKNFFTNKSNKNALIGDFDANNWDIGNQYERQQLDKQIGELNKRQQTLHNDTRNYDFMEAADTFGSEGSPFAAYSNLVSDTSNSQRKAISDALQAEYADMASAVLDTMTLAPMIAEAAPVKNLINKASPLKTIFQGAKNEMQAAKNGAKESIVPLFEEYLNPTKPTPILNKIEELGNSPFLSELDDMFDNFVPRQRGWITTDEAKLLPHDPTQPFLKELGAPLERSSSLKQKILPDMKTPQVKEDMIPRFTDKSGNQYGPNAGTNIIYDPKVAKKLGKESSGISADDIAEIAANDANKNRMKFSEILQNAKEAKTLLPEFAAAGLASTPLLELYALTEQTKNRGNESTRYKMPKANDLQINNSKDYIQSVMNSPLDWYDLGIESNENPLAAQAIKALNTRSYLDNWEGISPSERKDRSLYGMTPLLGDGLTNLYSLANQYSLANGGKQVIDPRVITGMEASELFGSYQDENNNKIPVVWNDMQTAPRHSQAQYAGTDEESPYVEDYDFYTRYTPGGKEFMNMLDEAGTPELGNFINFRYLADDPMWSNIIERVWEPYYEQESDENGKMNLRRDSEGRIIAEDMQRAMDWLNADENIFWLDRAFENPNDPTWRNFAGSSLDLLQHLAFLQQMGFEDWTKDPKYLQALGDDYASIVENLTPEQRAVYAALDLVDKQGNLDSGPINKAVLNALFERANEPYRLGKGDDYLSAEQAGRTHPYKYDFQYFFPDEDQIFKPYSNGKSGEEASANFFENYIDTILARNPGYGIQTQKELDNRKKKREEAANPNKNEILMPGSVTSDGKYVVANDGTLVPLVSFE